MANGVPLPPYINGTSISDIINLEFVSPGVQGGPATVGNDLVYSRGGSDDVSTGPGDDTIYAGTGADRVDAGPGNDRVYGEDGDDHIDAGPGNDYIVGGRGNDLIITGPDGDAVVLQSTGGFDTVTDFRASEPTVTITFNDLSPYSSGLPIPSGYAGLFWGNVAYVTGATYIFNPSGYNNVGLGTNVAFDPAGLGGTIASGGADFTLRSAYMAAAWRDGLQVTVQGWDDGVLVATQTITLDVNRTLVTFVGFDSIDRITFDGTGGTHHAGYIVDWDFVAIDDLTLAFESADVLQVPSAAVAAGLQASAVDYGNDGVEMNYAGYHVLLLGQHAADVRADWFAVA